MFTRPLGTYTLLAVALAGITSPLFAGFLGFGTPKETDVNVVVDLTEAGRSVAPPTKEKPAFYYPVLAGYRESGSLVAGENSPRPRPSPSSSRRPSPPSTTTSSAPRPRPRRSCSSFTGVT